MRNATNLFVLTLVILIESVGAQAPAALPQAQAPEASRSLLFTENGGRYNELAQFLVTSSAQTLWFTQDGFRISANAPRDADSDVPVAHNVFMSFEGRASSTHLVPGGELAARVHELSSDPAHNHVNLKTYDSIRYEGVYEGIDVRVWDNQGVLEYDLILKADADLKQVVLKFEGLENLRLEDGVLVGDTSLGQMRQEIPETYELDAEGVRHGRTASFQLLGEDRVGFQVENRDASRVLVIDPSVTMTLSSYLGGSIGEEGLAVTCAPDGCIYVAGEIRAPDFPGYPGPVASPISVPGQCKSMVTKLNAAGTQVVAVAVVDDPTGIGLSRAYDVKITSTNDVLVAGESWLGNFTTTPGAFQTSTSGGYETFVYKLPSDLSSLTFSTLLGGSGNDYFRDMCCLPNGNIVVVGMTESSDFPIAGTAVQGTSGGSRDGFLAVLSADGSSLVCSTYLGGAGDEGLNSCAINGNNIYVLGTGNTGFPTTAGAAQTTNGGGRDAWVGMLSSDCSAVLAGTWFGGANDQNAIRMAYCNGDIIIAGNTAAMGLPTTPGAFATMGSGGTDAFVACLNGALTTLNWSTYVGGSQDDELTDICVDAACNVWLTGRTLSADWPLTADAYDSVFSGTGDEAFINRLSFDGSTMDYGSYLGGDGIDVAAAIHCCPDGNVYVTGTTLSSNYPTLPGGVQPNYGGGYSDIFVNCFFVCDGPPASVVNQGPGCNVPGDVVITMTTPSVGSNVQFNLTSMFPNSHYWVWYSYGPLPVYTDPGSGCNVYVDVLNNPNFFLIHEGFTDATGSFGVVYPLPYTTAILGIQLHFQARIWAPGGPLNGDWLSNGLAITIGCP